MAENNKYHADSRQRIQIVRPPLARTFDVPTPDELMKVFQGDSVKLIFKGGSDTERMWVTVNSAGKMDDWTGTLDNDPVLPGVIRRIQYGDEVHFHPYDVIGIDLHKRIDQVEAEQRELEAAITPENKIERPWYKNSSILVPAIVGLIGAAATIVAVFL